MKLADRSSVPSAHCNHLANPGRRERRRFDLLEAIDRVARRMARAKPPVLAAVQAVLVGVAAAGSCASWLANLLPRLQHLVMWASIALVCAVVGGYAGFCGIHDARRYEILPDREVAPPPAAPVGPGADTPDAELVA